MATFAKFAPRILSNWWVIKILLYKHQNKIQDIYAEVIWKVILAAKVYIKLYGLGFTQLMHVFGIGL